ncbi:MAG TPA: MFS transporter [Bryobacteraceae bacterium]|nr:MFS transporter [Bryobacteraceae bacterium]
MLASYLNLLRANRNFRLLWMAQVVSELGDWFYNLAVINLLLELTHNRAQSVGLAIVLQVLPMTFTAPTAGVINDRISRRAIMIGADVARFFIVLGMLLVRTPSLVWVIYPLLLLETIGSSFFEPAHSAVIPNIVNEEEILTANALSAVTWSFCLAAGASLGGLVAVLLGRDAVFIINALSFLGSAWLIRRMNFHEPHTAGRPPLRARDLVDFTPVVEGARYIGADRRLFSTVFVKAGGGLLGANNVLLPLIGASIFPPGFHGLDQSRVAMLGMSLLMGARGVGALLGPLVAGRWAGSRESRLRYGILAGFLLAGGGYVLLGCSTSIAVAIFMVILAHSGGSTNWVFSTTLLQVCTTDRFRGRVFAAEYGLCMLAISASSYFAGVAIDLGTSARSFAILIGLVMLIPAGAWAATLAAGRRITSQGPPGAPSTPPESPP